MEYFFDASAGVNFGGDFDFAPAGGGSLMTSTTLPDFTGSSSHLDSHHHSGIMTSPSPFAFYGATTADPSAYVTSAAAASIPVDGAIGCRVYPPSNEAFPSSSSSVVTTDGSASTSLSDPVSSSSLSSFSINESPAGPEPRRFHDVSTGANPEESSSSSSSSAFSSSSSSSHFGVKGSVSSSFASPLVSNNDSNSDSGVASSSSSTSCANESSGANIPSTSSHDEAVEEGEEVSASIKEEDVPEEEEEEGEEQESQPPEEPTIDININNVVCSFSVRCHLNLRKIAMEACNTEYNRNRACVKLKLRKPKITASIWNSGKITCIGATSEEDSKIGARRVARLLMKMGFNVHFCRFRVVNVLASCTMPFAIRLHKFSAHHGKECEYEPELHPAATYRIKHPKATLKIFSTGSITITAPQVSYISPSVEHIYPRVQEFRMDEKDKESGEMSNLVPRAFVPLNTKHGRVKHIPKGPFHSKFKQVIHQQDLVKKAIQQVKDIESSDEDTMYMGCDVDEDDAEEL